MPFDPSKPDDVRHALSEYLARRLNLAEIQYAEPPQPMGDGYDTYIYAFRLAGDELTPEWTQPLVLRIYSSDEQGPKAMREAAVQRFVAERGYPAPRPLVVEDADATLGLPFMVMERSAGKPLLDRIGFNLLAVFRLVDAMAAAHVALHRLPIDGAPLTSDGPLVERQLAAVQAEIDRLQLEGFEEGWAWLQQHKSTVAKEELSFTHNDFHPLNILVDGDDRLTVIDWSDAALGDRHHDLARTLAVFWFAPSLARTRVERLALRTTRSFLIRRYLSRYRRQLQVDEERLRYWEAFHAFKVWGQLASLQVHGPEAIQAKQEVVERIPPGLLSSVQQYFQQRTR